MQVNLKTVLFTVLTIALVGSHITEKASAVESGNTKEKTKELVNDGKRATSKTARKVKDEVCEMVDGKMKCVGKKIKHAAQNASDNLEDALD